MQETLIEERIADLELAIVDDTADWPPVSAVERNAPARPRRRVRNGSIGSSGWLGQPMSWTTVYGHRPVGVPYRERVLGEPDSEFDVKQQCSCGAVYDCEHVAALVVD